MALEFRINDFAYPFSLLKLRATFEKTQWFSSEQQMCYQERLLHRVIEQAYSQVPYYRRVFDRLRLKPHDIRHAADLQKLPILTKQTVRDEFKTLGADNRNKFHPRTVCTSGTTGRPVQFLVDKPSNILEFVYYWRHWSWAGYRLGNCFAEFSTVFFRGSNEHLITRFQRMTNRLLLNSNKISASTVNTFVAAIRERRPLFLKGLPSALYYFCLFLREKRISDLSFQGVFSTGEKLLRRHRHIIESTFGCKVYDSYGQMERIVAISECPHGSLHLNPDYGILELMGSDGVVSSEFGGASRVSCGPAGTVIGTSLHCYSMPLLRYEVGDFVQMGTDRLCACGRQFPVVHSIDGRDSDVIITPEGEVITAAFLVFEEMPEILAGQLLQESVEDLRLRLVPTSRFSTVHERQSVSNVRKLVGPAVRIRVERCADVAALVGQNGKLRPVISQIDAQPCANLCPQEGRS